MTGWQRQLARWGVPIFMGLAYLALVITSEVSGIAKFLLGVVFCVVLVIWSMFRELTLHGALSRAASVGDPDELMTNASREVARRNAFERAPFQVYLAIAHYHRGQFDRAEQVLEEIAKVQVGASYRNIEDSRKIETMLTPEQLDKWREIQKKFSTQAK